MMSADKTKMSKQVNSLIGKTITVSHFVLNVKAKIGEGGYAWVYLVEDSQGQEYALKNVNCLTPDKFEQFKQEALILQSIPQHPNIVRLYAADINEAELIINFLFELCPATAIGILSKRILIKEEILVFFTAAAEATAFLHSQTPPVLHRDLKPENLLVSNDGTPKLCDFGSATRVCYDWSDMTSMDTAQDDIERNTTQNYRAPEMVDLYRRIPIGTASDVWALGCTLYKLIYRNDLFKPDERLPILQCKYQLPSDIDPIFSDLIHKCVQLEVNLRPSAAQIAAIARNARGDIERITVPASQIQVTLIPHANNQGIDNFQWFRYVQEQYKSWVSKGVVKWTIKATMASNDPPNSKHCRRVILASIRHAQVNGSELSKYLFNQRPWQSDSRVASKVLYLLMLLIQFESNIPQFNESATKVQKVVSHYSQQQLQSNKLSQPIIHLGRVIVQKLKLHMEHPQLEGNLALWSHQVRSKFVTDVKEYMACVVSETKQFLDMALKDRDFYLIVTVQPLIDEVSNGVTLLRALDKAATEIIHPGEAILKIARSTNYLDSSVEFPPENCPARPPLQRFVASQ